MRKVTAVLGVVVIANSYAFGGMVEFSKGEFNVLDPDLVRLDVTVVGDGPFDFADILSARTMFRSQIMNPRRRS